MLLDTVYNNLATTSSMVGQSVVKGENFHRAKLENAIDGYNTLYGDNVSILSSNEDCSEVILTKPKDQFKLVTKIEARLSGKKKFIETEDSIIMTRTWN